MMIARPIAKYPGLFVFIVLACIASVSSVIILTRYFAWYYLFNSLLQGIAWAYLATLCLSLCKNKILHYLLSSVIILFFGVGLLVELGSWALLHCNFAEDQLVLIIGTNTSEALGFIKHYLTLEGAFRLILFILGVIIVWGICTYLIKHLIDKAGNRLWLQIATGILVLCGGFLITLYFLATDFNKRAYLILSHNHTHGDVEFYSDPITKSLMMSREIMSSEKGLDKWRDFQYDVWHDANSVEYTDSVDYNVAVILGESMIKDFYNLADSINSKILPHMKAEYDSGHLIQFHDMLTVDPMTHIALRNALTLSDNRESDMSHGVYFPMLIKKAGWEVYFYSNQAHSPNSDYNLSRIFFTELNRTNVYNQYGDSTMTFDADWFEYLKRTKYPCEIASRTLSIYHFLSLHFHWEDRFKGKPIFSAEEFPRNWSKRKREEMASYATAMHSNDSIVYQIMQHLDRKGPAILIYFSDHGEFLQADIPGGNRVREQFNDRKWVSGCFEVPMMIWMNSQFIDEYPQLSNDIKDAVAKPGTTDNIGHTIMRICGVSGKYYRKDLDITTPEYRIHDRYDLKGHNLDQLLRSL